MNIVRFARFLITGAVNTLVGFGAYSCAVLAGVPPWLALLLGYVVGIAFNFLSIGGYVFRSLALARLPRFVLCYLFTLGVNLALLQWLAHWKVNPVTAQAIVTAPMAVLSYLLLSRLVFHADGRKRHAGPEG